MRSLVTPTQHTPSLRSDRAALSARSMVFCWVAGEGSASAAREMLYQIAFAEALKATATQQRSTLPVLCLN